MAPARRVVHTLSPFRTWDELGKCGAATPTAAADDTTYKYEVQVRCTHTYMYEEIAPALGHSEHPYKYMQREGKNQMHTYKYAWVTSFAQLDESSSFPLL